jgi:hypothetical protein
MKPDAARDSTRRRPAIGPGPTTWFDVVEDFLDAAVERPENVHCEFEDLTVDVPMRMGEGADAARWRLNGAVDIRVEGTRGPLAEWLRLWREEPR